MPRKDVQSDPMAYSRLHISQKATIDWLETIASAKCNCETTDSSPCRHEMADIALDMMGGA